MLVRWPDKALGFFSHLNDAESGGSASVPGGAVTLYGTCYAALARAYIDGDKSLTDRTREFLAKYQDFEDWTNDRSGAGSTFSRYRRST